MEREKIGNFLSILLLIDLGLMFMLTGLESNNFKCSTNRDKSL